MPRLLLMRHAKSSWADSSLGDHERPLNDRGVAASATMGKHLARERIQPDRLLVSTSRRTRETIAGVLAQTSGWPTPTFDERLYAASATTLAQLVRETGEEVRTLMLVAHNPGMQTLATALGGIEAWRAVGKFPTGALAMIEWEGRWAEAERGTLTRFVAPRDL